MTPTLKGAPKPPIQVTPAFTYDEIAQAFGVSRSYIEKEASAGRLCSWYRGKHKVCTQAQIDAWQMALEQRELDRRAGRVTRRDLRGKSAKTTKPRPSNLPVQADDDIKRQLGLAT